MVVCHHPTEASCHEIEWGLVGEVEHFDLAQHSVLSFGVG